jgi:hypothetical protein
VNISTKMRNADYGLRNGRRILHSRIHSAFRFPLSAFSAALIAFATVQLHAQTPIYSLPFFILFPTKYRLAKNLTFEGKDGSAIMVLASNVDLDLNGYVLEDITADNQSIGILVDHQQNVTIRNGKIRGFKQPIVLDDHSKRVTWPGNDLTFAKVAVQSVEASKDAPVDGGKEPQPKATTEGAKTTPSPTPSAEISRDFLDKYDATKSSPQATPSSKRHRHGGR